MALTIEEVGPEDVGNYTCTVSNAAAEDSYTGALVVKGKRGNPREVESVCRKRACVE